MEKHDLQQTKGQEGRLGYECLRNPVPVYLRIIFCKFGANYDQRNSAHKLLALLKPTDIVPEAQLFL